MDVKGESRGAGREAKLRKGNRKDFKCSCSALKNCEVESTREERQNNQRDCREISCAAHCRRGWKGVNKIGRCLGTVWT